MLFTFHQKPPDRDDFEGISKVWKGETRGFLIWRNKDPEILNASPYKVAPGPDRREYINLIMQEQASAYDLERRQKANDLAHIAYEQWKSEQGLA